jgi:hypothetical protein
MAAGASGGDSGVRGESIDDIYLSEREKEIICQVMEENRVWIGSYWYIVMRVNGRQELIRDASGELFECWIQANCEEAMRRMAKE